MSQIQPATTLPSALYVVATPIGHLGDLSMRALEILRGVDLILAEDTRVTGQLLKSVGVDTRMISLNAHSEAGKSPRVLDSLRAGESLALVSDAGTPAISDPGRLLVEACHAAGLPVIPIPGPSALAAALSVSGLPASPSHFIGFLPAKGGARQSGLDEALRWPGTLILYEAPHRIEDLAKRLDQVAIGRQVVFAREMTKAYEQLVCVTGGQCANWFECNPDRIRGEFVVMVGPQSSSGALTDLNVEQLLSLLARELPPSKAASIAAELTGLSKRELYRQLTDQKEE